MFLSFQAKENNSEHGLNLPIFGRNTAFGFDCSSEVGEKNCFASQPQGREERVAAIWK